MSYLLKSAPRHRNFRNGLLPFILNDWAHTPDQPKTLKPKANIIEEDGQFLIELAIPGYSKDDIEILLEKDSLTIKSSLDTKYETTYRLREFGTSSFERKFILSENIDQDSIQAKFVNGVLVIHLSKKEIAEPTTKTIEIK